MLPDLEVDFDALWQKQVGAEVPAVVTGKGGRGFTFLRLEYPIVDQWGEEHSRLKCREVTTDDLGHYVVAKISDETNREGQPPSAKLVAVIEKEDHDRLLDSHPLFALRHAVRSFERKAAGVEGRLDEMAKERVAAEKKRLEKAREAFEKEKAAIPKAVLAGIESGVQKVLGPERKKLEEDRSTAEALLKDAQAQLEAAEAKEARLEALQDQADQFLDQGGPAFMEILRRAAPEEVQPRDKVEATPLPGDLFKRCHDHLDQRNYFVDEATLARFVLATVTAMATGQFVLLSGPTGVGKTSLVRRAAELLGAGPETGGVIPVRPAWLDPADLVGFYNAAADRYESTPFVDALVGAQRHAEANEATFLVLDEMNLARIENYGADLLALLEKSRENLRLGRDDTATLPLYADATANRLADQIIRLTRRREATKDGSDGDDLDARIKELERQRATTPSRLAIPRGVVVFGTLNADETTHTLSPKVKDRAFVLQLPAPSLSKTPSTRAAMDVEVQWPLTHSFVSGIEADAELPSWASAAWADIRTWETPYLKPLGVHLSRRFEALFRFYTAAAHSFGLAEEKSRISGREVVSGFLEAKLLPWIAFHRDEEVKRDGKKEAETKAEVLKEWRGQLDKYPALQKEAQTILDGADLTYEYVR